MSRPSTNVVFARRVFTIAATYGLVVLLPQYFLEGKVGRDVLITHPEYYYGFLGVAASWQIAFFLIASDPCRYRLLMIPAILEKASFALATILLFSSGRVSGQMLGAGLIDLTLGVLFVVAYVRMSSSTHES